MASVLSVQSVQSTAEYQYQSSVLGTNPLGVVPMYRRRYTPKTDHRASTDEYRR
jgi:hypothetical protein